MEKLFSVMLIGGLLLDDGWVQFFKSIIELLTKIISEVIEKRYTRK